MSDESQELFRIVVHGVSPSKDGKLFKGVGTGSRPKPLVHEPSEAPPRRHVVFLAEAHIPLLHAPRNVVRGVPHSLIIWNLLPNKELLTTVNPWQWIFLTIICQESELVVAWNRLAISMRS